MNVCAAVMRQRFEFTPFARLAIPLGITICGAVTTFVNIYLETVSIHVCCSFASITTTINVTRLNEMSDSFMIYVLIVSRNERQLIHNSFPCRYN